MYDYFFLFQLAALLVYSIQFNKLKSTLYKWFLPYLIVMAVYEFGTFNGWFTVSGSNHWSFNIISTLEFLFYGYFLFRLLRKNKAKRIFTLALCFTLFVTTLNIFFIQGFWKLHTYSYLLQSVVIIAATCMFFYQLMQNVQSKIPLFRNPDFWLCTGLLFYYLGSFMFFASFSHMAYKGNPNYTMLYQVIYNFYNIILYVCLINSFLCFRKTKMLSYL